MIPKQELTRKEQIDLAVEELRKALYEKLEASDNVVKANLRDISAGTRLIRAKDEIRAIE